MRWSRSFPMGAVRAFLFLLLCLFWAPGLGRLDAMLGGKGYYRGSSVLVSGAAGTGKTSLAAYFAQGTVARGERCLWFAFEESSPQIIRNMRSIGIDLEPWVTGGLLKFQNSRPTMYGLEAHLVAMHKTIDVFAPAVIVVDPISNLVSGTNESEVKSMLSRLIDYLKIKQVTAFCTDLISAPGIGGSQEGTEAGISSLMDTWLFLQTMEMNGERNRGLYILKSRGMEHSNQVREFTLSDSGIQLRDVYIGSSGVLTGSARTAQEAKEMAETLVSKQEIERKQREIERKKTITDAQIAALLAQYEAEKDILELVIAREKLRDETLVLGNMAIARNRQEDELPHRQTGTGKTGKAGRK